MLVEVFGNVDVEGGVKDGVEVFKCGRVEGVSSSSIPPVTTAIVTIATRLNPHIKQARGFSLHFLKSLNWSLLVLISATLSSKSLTLSVTRLEICSEAVSNAVDIPSTISS